PRLDKTRWWCLSLTGSLLWISLVGHVPTSTLVLSCLGFLISLQAVALASFADRETVDEERSPAWWPEFERDFRIYASQASEGGGTG
ncbi:MAG: hypothetical protein ACRDK0_09235, partial [Solirubrobacteraceae bacterium]